MTTESESISLPYNMEKCSFVLIDVAGTTTSTDFIKDTLFKFVNEKIEAFLKEKWEESSVKDCIKALKTGDSELTLESALEKIKELTLENSSNKGLKDIQGLVYKQGYESGDLKAHLFEDVAECFENWSKKRPIAIFSTGSVESQKLLFTHTINGNISGHISHFFDQEVGSKTESESYKSIAKTVGVASEEIIFITDDLKEATSAKEAGLHSVLIKREDNKMFPEDIPESFMVISSFKDLHLDKIIKRKNEGTVSSEEEPPLKSAKTEEIVKDEKKEDDKSETMEVDVPTTESKTEEKSEETEIHDKTEKIESDVKAPVEKMEAETNLEHAEISVPVENTEKDKIVEDKKVETGVTEEMQGINEGDGKIASEPDVETKTEDIATEPKLIVEEKNMVVDKDQQSAEVLPEKLEVAMTEEKPIVEENKITETTENKKDEQLTEKVEDKQEETTESSKADQPEDTKIGQEEVKSVEETDKPPEEAKTEVENNVEGKENKSDLANGVDKEGTEKNGVETSIEEQTEQVVVKKLEECAENKTVSVEV